ncbi:MAG: hypothetical protein OXC91_02790 [Rhodobacteraceae bacterium]|nr:hypothetical protein [Paracoccaceae bacterium]
MKEEILEKLNNFRDDLMGLARESRAKKGKIKEIRSRAEKLAMLWADELRSPLEHKFKLPLSDIFDMAEQMKNLSRLSQKNSRRTSYQKVLESPTLRDFGVRFITPIQQNTSIVEVNFNFHKQFPNLPSAQESEYMGEAIGCANASCFRAAVVMGWCAAVDKIQQHIGQKLGFDEFNCASKKMKEADTGKFKRWTKEFSISTLSGLQELHEGDLIDVLEYLEVFDSNQSKRLHICREYRNQSAHPADAHIGEGHLRVVFSDIEKFIFSNSKMKR